MLLSIQQLTMQLHSFQHIEQRGKQDLKLVLRGRLDRERKSHYNFRVVAFDGGTPPLTGVINVLINVQDINDNAPVFPNDTYYVTVPEDMAVGRSVITVTAQDSDEGANGEVRLNSQCDAEASHFSV